MRCTNSPTATKNSTVNLVPRAVSLAWGRGGKSNCVRYNYPRVILPDVELKEVEACSEVFRQQGHDEELPAQNQWC